MDPVWLAALGAVLGPLAGIATGLLLDRRSKETAELTTDVAQEEAATHRFEAQVTSWERYTAKVEADAEALEKKLKDLEERLEVLTTDLELILEYADTVDQLVPAEERPTRPTLSVRKAA